MALVKQDSLRDIENLFDQYSEALGWSSGRGRVPVLPESWSPRVDVYETDSEFRIKAEIPDVKKEDVSVKVDDDVLTISGERRQEKEEEGTKLHRVERYFGSFVRRFSLPDNADGSHVTAMFRNGVLDLQIPKKPVTSAAAMSVKID